MSKRTNIIGSVVLLLVTGAALAAARYVVRCKHQDCDFSVTYSDPNSFATRAIAGYCAHCTDIVTIESGAIQERRRREEMQRRGMDISQLKPIENTVKPKFVVWDPKTGEDRELYECPKCRNLFFAYDLTYCPKCKRPSLESRQVGDHYD